MTNNTFTKSSHFRLCRTPGAKAANTIFKVFSMTRLGRKPQSTGYQVDDLNRYTKRRLDGRVVRVSASEAVDSGLIPSRVKRLTLKLVFAASLLDVQH